MATKKQERRRYWFRSRVCDKRRWYREMNKLAKADAFVRDCWNAMHNDGDDSARLVLADYVAEKYGNEYLSMFLRESIFVGTKAELRKQRKKDNR